MGSHGPEGLPAGSPLVYCLRASASFEGPSPEVVRRWQQVKQVAGKEMTDVVGIGRCVHAITVAS